MEFWNTILGIFASLLAIGSALFSWDTNKKVKNINKSQSRDRGISVSGDNNRIVRNKQKKRE